MTEIIEGAEHAVDSSSINNLIIAGAEKGVALKAEVEVGGITRVSFHDASGTQVGNTVKIPAPKRASGALSTDDLGPQGSILATQALAEPTNTEAMKKLSELTQVHERENERWAKEVISSANLPPSTGERSTPATNANFAAILASNGFDKNANQFQPDAAHEQATSKSPSVTQVVVDSSSPSASR